MTDEQYIYTMKVHFAIKNKILIEDIQVEIEGKTDKGNIYRIKYLGRDKTIDWMDSYLVLLYESIVKGEIVLD